MPESYGGDDTFVDAAEVLIELGAEPREVTESLLIDTGTRDPSAFEDQLVNAIFTAGQNTSRWEEGHRLMALPRLEVKEDGPVPRFLRSIMEGRVEKMMSYCDDVGPSSEVLVLTRTAKTWMMGCKLHTQMTLASLGQDTRCDWCGKPRPDAMPPLIIKVGILHVVAQFCWNHHRAIDAGSLPAFG